MTAQPDFKTQAFRDAFVDAMTDEELTQDEIKNIVRTTLRRDKNGAILDSREIQDLLLLSQHHPQSDGVTRDWLRRYVLGLLLTYVKAKPPPVTELSSFEIAAQDAGGDYRVRVQVLDDAVDRTVEPQSADTKIHYAISSWKSSFHPRSKRVQSVSQWPRLESPVTIQTSYGLLARKSAVSVYGRGTTSQDILAGTFTLGFHESCHRQDQVQFLKNQPLPRFAGRLRMTQPGFERLVERYQQAVRKYFDDLKRDSLRRTDEVGFRRSEHNASAESVLSLFRANHPYLPRKSSRSR